MEHKDIKSCRETPGTNTRNGHVQMEHPWTLLNETEELLAKQQQRKDNVFFSGKEDKHEYGV